MSNHVVHIGSQQQLTTEQAIIIQGYTGIMMAGDLFISLRHDLERRTGMEQVSSSYVLENLDQIRDIYRDDWKALMGRDAHTIKAKVEQAIIDKAFGDPFGKWDSQVDVIVDIHVPIVIQEMVRSSILELPTSDPFLSVTFTKRPGDKAQTWITVTRQDPIDSVMTEAIYRARNALGIDYSPGRQVTLDFHVPPRAEQDLLNRLNTITNHKLELARPRFKREQTILTITDQ